MAHLDDPDAPHEQGPYIASALETVTWAGHRIRVPPLSAALRTCERRGLDERVELIRQAMNLRAGPGLTSDTPRPQEQP